MNSITSKIQPTYLQRLIFLGRAPLSRYLCTSTAKIEIQTQKLERIADEILGLNKLKKYDYSILFRKMGLNKYRLAVSGLDSSATSAASTGTDSAETKAAEKTVFDIKLDKFDATAKFKFIKEVRAFTDLGLKEAKDLVEKAPVVVKKGVTKEEGNSIVEKLQWLGATEVLE